jgi:hypothetical protein
VQRASISVGSHREDVVRFMTFVQRMRRNGGDAGDAAWYMIRHHFDYNDLTALREAVRAQHLPLLHLVPQEHPAPVRRAAAPPRLHGGRRARLRGHGRGQSPDQCNWSKLNPMLPDLTGAVPKVPGLPSYINEQMAAVPLNWNDHAVYLGFGAPMGRHGPRERGLAPDVGLDDAAPDRRRPPALLAQGEPDGPRAAGE